MSNTAVRAATETVKRSEMLDIRYSTLNTASHQPPQFINLYSTKFKALIWNDALYYTQQLEIYPAQTNPFQTLFEVVISLSLVQFFPKSNSYLSDISRVHSSGQILPLHILMVWLYVPIMTWADQIIWFL
jgi:hypothetical protein